MKIIEKKVLTEVHVSLDFKDFNEIIDDIVEKKNKDFYLEKDLLDFVNYIESNPLFKDVRELFEHLHFSKYGSAIIQYVAKYYGCDGVIHYGLYYKNTKCYRFTGYINGDAM